MLRRPPTDADRKRERKRARDRRRYVREINGRRVAPVDYTSEMVNYLARYEWLEGSRDDPRAIGDAIFRMVQDAVEADRK
ncbi:hypothetical protein I6F20_17035 [Bradyrhizobium sp. IC3123]|uniref:hypothetical protein n=1 Tax=Bradyrhizobium sp. IC3123 TaxID=2793803 RepID=UPI001CD58618|nr:hypothetical protein [Bradyrhizobium sp. IC3123]MCA1390773.1 hypothetical protein [Bradyrhizobium sp. IC3123]